MVLQKYYVIMVNFVVCAGVSGLSSAALPLPDMRYFDDELSPDQIAMLTGSHAHDDNYIPLQSVRVILLGFLSQKASPPHCIALFHLLLNMVHYPLLRWIFFILMTSLLMPMLLFLCRFCLQVLIRWTIFQKV